jgi:homoserine O-acetyltransferase
MPSDSPAANAIGLVETKTVDIEQPLVLACGVTLPVHRLAYETYGELNTQRNNGILICHALSGDHHAAGIHAGESRPGWWDHYIGPGKPLDSDKFFIVSVNNIGSCFGSTGPTTINPETGQPWGAD